MTSLLGNVDRRTVEFALSPAELGDGKKENCLERNFGLDPILLDLQAWYYTSSAKWTLTRFVRERKIIGD